MSAFAKTVKTFKQVIFAITAITLTACGGGGGGGSTSPTAPTSVSFSGNVVDGPVIYADVSLYDLTYGASVSVNNTAIDTATTDASAKIQGLSIPLPLPTAPYAYVLEFTENVGTTLDLSTCDDPVNPTAATCSAPVISTMRTVLTDEMISGGKNIYATPLTTMAVNIALTKAKGGSSYDNNPADGTIDAAEFKAAVQDAALAVTSTLGFGMDSSVNIFDTPPLIDETIDSPEEQQAVSDYRTAVAAVSAIINEMDSQATGDADTVMTELAADLSDGLIDGQVDPDGDGVSEPSQVFSDTTIQVLDQDPATLVIPGTTTTVAEIESQLEAESEATSGTSVTLDASVTTEPEPASTNPDRDNDGVLNAEDAFPDDATRDTDTDGDGLADLVSGSNVGADQDDDNDGVLDGSDAFPLDPTETTDTDGDGIGNNADDNDDGDSAPDATDDFPLDPTKQNKSDVDNDGWDVDADPNDNDNTVPGIAFVDTDGDGLADNGGNLPDGDDDNDGVTDGSDAFPLDATETTDTDGDGTGNNADTDDDGDGVLDNADAFPLDSTETKDTDNDGIGNNTDADDDGDGLSDATEDAAAADPDGDGKPNREDIDSDGDGYLDSVDIAPYDDTQTINFAPVAADLSITTDEDVAANGSVSATDLNSDSLTYSLVGAASNGTAVVNADGSYNYTPAADFNGSDSFTFKAQENATADTYNSNIATVTVTINPVNDAPVAAADSSSTNEDTAVTTGNVLSNDTDTEGDTLSISAADATSANGGTVTNNGDGTFTYTPAANFNGSDSFDYTVSDGNGTDVGTVTITVNAVNDAPTATAGTLTVDEDSGANAGTVAGSDVDGDSLTYAVATNAANGTVTITDANTGAYTYTPNADFNGSDSFTFVANDSTVDSAPATVDITVNAVNDAPVATAGTLTVDEDSGANAGTVAGSDVDGDSLTYAVATNAANGTVTITDANTGAYTYTPNADFNGADSFTFVANDGTVDSAAATVSITVNPVNDAPVANADSATVQPDGSVIIDVISNDTDVDGDSLSVTALSVSAPTGGSGTGTAVDNGDGTITYTATGDLDTETVTFTYTAFDGTVSSTAATVTVYVSANPPPTANAGTLTVDEDSSANPGTLTASDADGIASYAIASAASNGTVTLTDAATGAYTYTPNADYNGADSFTFTATDTVGGISTAATISVTVNAVNDAPTATAGTLTVDEDSGANAGTVAGSDVDGDSLTYAVATNASNGTVTITDASTGAYTYTPNADYNGADSFTFVANDGTVDSVAATIDITVNAVNDAPVAVDDSASTGVNNPVTTGNVMSNDSDVDGDTLTITAFDATSANGGTVSYNGNSVGTFTYTPATDFTGEDTFGYTLSDGVLTATWLYLIGWCVNRDSYRDCNRKLGSDCRCNWYLEAYSHCYRCDTKRWCHL
ncbi:MAG: Ig-like domain-containing protein [Gammaproteobacteria bacterium]